jgi:hypothetical protein
MSLNFGFNYTLTLKQKFHLNLFQKYRWVKSVYIFLGHSVYRTGRKVYPSPPSSTEVKNEWRYTSTPPLRLHDIDGDIFTSHCNFFLSFAVFLATAMLWLLSLSGSLLSVPYSANLTYSFVPILWLNLQNYRPTFLNSETYSVCEVTKEFLFLGF